MRLTFLLSTIGVMSSVSLWAQEASTSDDAAIAAGVTFIDAQSQNEVLRQYLLPSPIFVDEDQSDEALYEFMNQKIKWEEND